MFRRKQLTPWYQIIYSPQLIRFKVNTLNENKDSVAIRLDSQLTMKTHLEHLYRATVPMVYTLAHIRKFVDTSTVVLIFKAHILSRLEYGSALCIGANNIYLDRSIFTSRVMRT